MYLFSYEIFSSKIIFDNVYPSILPVFSFWHSYKLDIGFPRMIFYVPFFLPCNLLEKIVFCPLKLLMFWIRLITSI